MDKILHYQMIAGVELQYFLMLAGWVVYKFQNFIWNEPGDIENGEQYGGVYKTQAEAQYKTQKQLQRDWPESSDLVENSVHYHWEEGFYWAKILVTSVCRIIFVPVKNDD